MAPEKTFGGRLKIWKILVFSLSLLAPAWADGGRAYVVYNPVKTDFGRIVETAFKQNKSFEELTDRITKTYKLPRDLTLVFGETGQARTWYDPEHHRIMMSYEFIQALTQFFSTRLNDASELDSSVAGCVLFSAYHEFGLALISELDIPTTGSDEDAADELGAYLLGHSGNEPAKSALAAAHWFSLLKKDDVGVAIWDDHMPEQSKLFAMLGLVYAADPARYVFLQGVVPEAALQHGVAEYPRKEHNWARLLKEFQH
jgi:hypothetical protein